MLTIYKSKTLLRLLNNSCCKCFKQLKHKKAKKQVVSKEKSYTSTVCLPKTDFQLWVNKLNIIERDEKIIKSEEFANLYNWQRENVNGPEFVLHDGPPYANGIPHMGHALNKILKDIILRHKLLIGQRVHYKPGWDCHGLPIELKATARHFPAPLSPLDVRKIARRYAKDAIADQKAVFRSWAVMGDWDNGCYHTFDKSYVKNQLQQFYKLYEQGLVYRDVKPVFWSPSSRTALAESELEYRDDHKSTSTYVRLRLVNVPQHWGDDVYALIWTTTPWSLPANQAIAYSPNLPYCLARVGKSRRKYLVAKPTIERLAITLDRNVTAIEDVEMGDLQSVRYSPPVGEGSEPLPLVPGVHVTATKGTGLVHTAPAHGPDDYKLARLHNLPVRCLVDEGGFFTDEAGPQLVGLSVLTEGAERVLEQCRSAGLLVHAETFTHSYPYDWRTNLPVILKASQQWFFDTTAVKQAAIDAMSRVRVVPERGMAGFMAQVQNRPFWCISRQRVWGVPIPVLYTTSGQHIISRELVDHYCGLLDSAGDDFWWSVPLSELAPDQLLSQWNVGHKDVDKGQDILDIWMDSGLSWSSVLDRDRPTADLYLEGVDQFNGWFQSSLLMSVALQGVPPYKTVFVHGFAVDGNGQKMSKSLGNVVNPQDILLGGSDQVTNPALGVDVLRWWVAAHASHRTNVPVSEATLAESKSEVQRMRSLMRFLLGAVNGMPPLPTSHQTAPRYLDRFMLDSLYSFLEQIVEHYENYQFNRVCLTLNNFIANEVSAIYCSIIKDRLYCLAEDSADRRSAQLTMFHMLTGLTRAIAPILPVLVEEVYTHQPYVEGGSVFHRIGRETWSDPAWRDPEAAALVKQVLELKQQVIRLTPINSNSWDVSVTISAPERQWQSLQALQPETESSESELAEILQVSRVTLTPQADEGDVRLAVSLSGAHQCGRCRRYTAPAPDLPCPRCADVLAALQ